MTTIRYSLPVIEHAIRDVCSVLGDRAFVSWEEHSEDDLWRELIYCILGSRVKFQVAHAAVETHGWNGFAVSFAAKCTFRQL